MNPHVASSPSARQIGWVLACRRCGPFPCLSVLFLVTGLPLVGAGVLLGGWLEVLVIVASVVLAASSPCCGVRRHGRWRVLIVLSAALTMIAVRRFLASEPYEMMCVVVEAVVLAVRTPLEPLPVSDLRGV
jgi:MerC mercury resistance protein